MTGTIPGGYGDALSTLFRNNYPTWNVALNVSYPLGNSAQEAAVARARVQSNQVEAQLRQIELQIATDVTNAATQVQNNVEVVQAAQAAREFAQRQLEAEQSKFEVGMSTNYFVVQAQRDLATAQNNELQAVLAYRRSLVELERLQQTTLQTANITLYGSGTGTVGASVINSANSGTATTGRGPARSPAGDAGTHGDEAAGSNGLASCRPGAHRGLVVPARGADKHRDPGVAPPGRRTATSSAPLLGRAAVKPDGIGWPARRVAARQLAVTTAALSDPWAATADGRRGWRVSAVYRTVNTGLAEFAQTRTSRSA